MNPVGQVAHPPRKPVLLFDGDCGFCQRWVLRWRVMTAERVECVPFQSARVALEFPELAREHLARSVNLVETDGRMFRGAEAIFRSLACVKPWPLWLYRHVPGAALGSEAAYRLVAANRQLFSWLSRWR
jgi:predicted DCC family thiol-disulfide oxidoreductase YuxK